MDIKHIFLFTCICLELAYTLPQNHEDFNQVQSLNDLNPNATMRVPELIKQCGYPVEVHHVITEDGYVLEMHRIPYGLKSGKAEGKPVAFVMHGLISSSADWIIAGPERGIGFLLADRGYDVWMGNARGNFYSKSHVKPTPPIGEFWDFSWHEIGIYDLPAMIDYALNTTNQTKAFYIGHSQGTTSFYVMCSQRPEYNNKIRAMFSLAPIAYMSHLKSPLMRIIAPLQNQLSILLKLIGLHEFLPSNKLMALAGKLFCSNSSYTEYLCTNVLFIICGFDSNNLDRNLLPIIMGHTPAGSSSKQFLHYAQNIDSGNFFRKGKFRLYNYGIVKNLIKYKSIEPPSYDLSKITAPVALHYGRNDWMAAEVDVLRLASELKNLIGRFPVADENFNHLDFLWGINVKQMVYDRVFSLMTKY